MPERGYRLTSEKRLKVVKMNFIQLAVNRTFIAINLLKMYDKLKQIYNEVKNHDDLSYKSAQFFATKLREIRVELLKVSSEQGEQISRDVTDAVRFITISEREDMNNIQNYPKEVPKYLGRVKTVIVSNLAFVMKQRQ